ncbi:MAG: hypothetical protein ACTSUW_05370 [Candidatus Heimdallarchaeota archaeon]
MYKKHILGLVIVSVLFMSINSENITNVNSNDLLPIEIWITYLSWYISDQTLPGENSSHFEFDMDFIIYNPNDENVTLTFPNLRQFYGNISIELENPNHNASLYHGGDFPAISERTLEPGVSEDSLPFLMLIFETPDLIDLPDGNYSFWILGGSPFSEWSVITSYHTNVTIDDGLIFIDYFVTILPTTPTTSPTLEINISYSVLYISSFIFIGVLHIIKKKRKKISEYF